MRTPTGDGGGGRGELSEPREWKWGAGGTSLHQGASPGLRVPYSPPAPQLPLTRKSPPACRRASRSGPRTRAPPRRLRQRSAAACGWRPPSGRRGRGLCGRPRRRSRRPGDRRRSWSASARCRWRRARLPGRESAARVGGQFALASALEPACCSAASVPLPGPPGPRPSLRAPGGRGHSQADGVRGSDRRSGSSCDADLASAGSGP